MVQKIYVFGRCDSLLQKCLNQAGEDYILLETAEEFDSAEFTAKLIIIDSALGLRRNCEICRSLRSKTTVPLLIFTSYHDETDEFAALTAGCDVFYSKAVDFKLFSARLAALLALSARSGSAAPVTAVTAVASPASIVLGKLNVDTGNCMASANGRDLELTAMEYKILELLIRNINRTFNRQQIIDNTQGFAFEGFERTIDSHIKNLRKKIAESAPQQSYIKTVYGLGYKISEPTPL